MLEHLQGNLKNDQRFYEQVLTPFANHAINTSELKIRQENIPSPKRTKKLKACWKNKIKNLELIVESCKQDILEKEELAATEKPKKSKPSRKKAKTRRSTKKRK